MALERTNICYMLVFKIALLDSTDCTFKGRGSYTGETTVTDVFQAVVTRKVMLLYIQPL